MTWIADGESGSAVRAKLNALMVPISSIAISSPVEYVDVALPAGYASFRMIISGVKVDAPDFLVCLTSRDGGASFDIDDDNYDTYIGPNIIKHANGTFDSDPAGALSEVSGLANLTANLDTAAFPVPLFLNLDIAPGDSSSYPVLLLFQAAGGAADVNITIGFWTLNPLAMNPAPLGRINRLRFMPDGNEDNPPTGGGTIIAGQFTLFGIPSA